MQDRAKVNCRQTGLNSSIHQTGKKLSGVPEKGLHRAYGSGFNTAWLYHRHILRKSSLKMPIFRCVPKIPKTNY